MTFTFKELGKKGQLGNQLFQISGVIGAALYYGDDWILPSWKYADHFSIPSDKFSEKIQRSQIYLEPHFHYRAIPNSNGKLLNLSGYFQSYKYWQDHSNIIKKLLSPKIKSNFNKYTALHVRRTDYLIHEGCYNILSKNNYYEKAMEVCDSKNYLIFSDDISWCKKNFIGNQFSFSEERRPVIDLANMISCSNFIIANSSFSWWGAFLSKSKGKKVVAPSCWFGPKLRYTHNTKDLIPPNWLKV
jgi:hypothetical protein